MAKTVYVRVRVEPAEHAKMLFEAKKQGRTLSDWLRRVAMGAADRQGQCAHLSRRAGA